MPDDGRQVLEEAYQELEAEMPERLARALRWLRAPQRLWLRVSLGVLFIAASSLSFLPMLGIELLPIGLLFLAQDAPFLRKPIGRAILWLVHKYRALKRHWQRRRERRMRDRPS